MDEHSMIEKLLDFGLTRQEAAIYLCFLGKGELTGYEVAKQTGISRSNVYSALTGLSGKGAIYLIEGNASKYMAVPVTEFCDNHIRYLSKAREFLCSNISAAVKASEGYITIEGCRHIRDKIHHMLLTAEKRIYLSAAAEFIDTLSEEILLLLQKKIKVVLITDRMPSYVTGQEVILYLKPDNEEASGQGQLRLIIDSAYVLTGDVSGSGTDNCLYCAQKNFVNVFKEAMHNEIRLIELQTSKESRGENL